MTLHAENGLVVRGVCKRFGARSVLEGVDLEAPCGALTALLGENGAGKSTLFKILMGLLSSDGGTATLDGQDLLGTPLHAKAALGIGYLSQESTSFPHLSARLNLRAILELLIADRRARIAEEAKLLAQVGLESLADARYATLSTGEQRRLEIAKAVAGNPRVLLLDEPFSGLDPLIIDGLAQLLRSLTEQGLSVLLTDHHVAPTLGFVDSVHLLSGGRIVLSGTPEAISSDDRAARLYFGQLLRS